MNIDEKKLTTKARNALPQGDFVFKKDRRYPIEDKNHARNALARVSQHGTPAEKAKVRAAVHSKYPKIGESIVAAADRLLESPDEDKWLKGAVNPKHKGYCTPMRKKTCTPRRKALARRFKRGDLHETLSKQADRLLEHCGHCQNDEMDSERFRELIRKFVTAGYDLETAKAMAYQAYHEDPNVVTPPKASFYPSDGGMSGGGGGITSA